MKFNTVTRFLKSGILKSVEHFTGWSVAHFRYQLLVFTFNPGFKFCFGIVNFTLASLKPVM